MTAYSHIMSSNYVSVMNLETGELTRITSDNPNYQKAVELVKRGDFEAVEKMTIAAQIKQAMNADARSFAGYLVWIDEGVVKYRLGDGLNDDKELHNALTSRLVRMAAEGHNMKPLMNFLANLLSNPSKTAIDELYLFLEATELPITDDGCFIAYKIVANDYTSHYDRKFMNLPGTVVSMPRNEVDDQRDVTCSTGLHFCSKGYLKSYGQGRDGADRLVLVKINPADVVSIPSDYNNAKGRASKYLIWKDITEPNWRAKYDCTDYNTSAVEKGWVDDEPEQEVFVPPVHVKDEERGYETDGRCPNCTMSQGYQSKGEVYRFGEYYLRRKCRQCGTNYYVKRVW